MLMRSLAFPFVVMGEQIIFGKLNSDKMSIWRSFAFSTAFFPSDFPKPSWQNASVRRSDAK